MTESPSASAAPIATGMNRVSSPMLTQTRLSEKDLDDAIMREMERFLLELGIGFTFVARQKRITVDNDDYYLDLLFFHRGMRRLVAIELKLGDFKPADKGQMELSVIHASPCALRTGRSRTSPVVKRLARVLDE